MPGISSLKLSESWRIDACSAVDTTTADIAAWGGFFALGGDERVAMASAKGIVGDALINEWIDWSL